MNENTSGDTAALMETIELLKGEKNALEAQVAAGTTVVEGPSNEEMERLLQQGLKQRETMKVREASQNQEVN